MARVNAKEACLLNVEVLGRYGLFTNERVNSDTVPEGWYMYEVRHDDECQGEPVEIALWVMVNHWGTLLVKEPFDLEKSQFTNNAYLYIDPEEDWNYLGEIYSF